MLDNYTQDKNGVIKQITRPTEMLYDEKYVVDRYSTAPVKEMSHLRLGYIIGSIGFIPDSILDIGYGSGDFLKAATKIIPKVFGYDIPPAYPVDGVENVESPFNNTYDVVTFFDSLEHFEDIYTIRALQTRYIVISVPWCHNFSDEWFRDWKHRRPNEHLWHFDSSSLVRFMDDVGYELLNKCSIEDTIRKSSGTWKNILTATFRCKQ